MGRSASRRTRTYSRLRPNVDCCCCAARLGLHVGRREGVNLPTSSRFPTSGSSRAGRLISSRNGGTGAISLCRATAGNLVFASFPAASRKVRATPSAVSEQKKSVKRIYLSRPLRLAVALVVAMVLIHAPRVVARRLRGRATELFVAAVEAAPD